MAQFVPLLTPLKCSFPVCCRTESQKSEPLYEEDDEEEILGSDDDEQEDPKDYTKGNLSDKSSHNLLTSAGHILSLVCIAK